MKEPLVNHLHWHPLSDEEMVKIVQGKWTHLDMGKCLVCPEFLIEDYGCVRNICKRCLDA